MSVVCLSKSNVANPCFAEANTNGQSNCSSFASNSINNSNTSSITSKGLASGLSILFIHTITGS